MRLPVIRAKGRDATQCGGGSDLPRKVGGSRCGEKVGFRRFPGQQLPQQRLALAAPIRNLRLSRAPFSIGGAWQPVRTKELVTSVIESAVFF